MPHDVIEHSSRVVADEISDLDTSPEVHFAVKHDLDVAAVLCTVVAHDRPIATGVKSGAAPEAVKALTVLIRADIDVNAQALNRSCQSPQPSHRSSREKCSEHRRY